MCVSPCAVLVRICTYKRSILQEFAGEGLRTLVLAYKELDVEYFSQWQQRHHVASTELEDRESKLDELYEEIEKDLLVGGKRLFSVKRHSVNSTHLSF